MRLLILSFYYPPDLSAGSFRCEALVNALKNSMPEGLQVDIVTTRPNRYQSLIIDAPDYEKQGSFTIRRIPMPSHQSGMADQSLAFLSFARGALSAIKGRKYDAVFGTSSRLMTAVLAAKAARNSGAPLYLDIRDLFVDTMGDVLGTSPLRFLLPAFGMLERQTFSQAERINIVSPGFAGDVRQAAPNTELRDFTNGIDTAFLDQDYSKPTDKDGPVILYAGNIGEGQGLHRVIPEAARLVAGKARFHIVGDGGKLDELRTAIEPVQNSVTLKPPVPRSEMVDLYRNADMLLIHLNDHAAFHKVLPSKLFEYAATGKPILAGVAGMSAEFLRSEVPGSFVFDPCDAKAMARAIDEAHAMLQPVDRGAFLAKYTRSNIMAEMARDLIGFVEEASTAKNIETTARL